MVKFRCVIDTSLLYPLVRYVPGCCKHLDIQLPNTMILGKELRNQRPIQNLVKTGAISQYELCERDRNIIYRMIKDTFSSSMANNYRRGKMKKESVEFECGFVASKNNIPIYLIDKLAKTKLKKFLRKSRRDHLVKGPNEFLADIPLNNDDKTELKEALLTQGMNITWA